MSSLCDGLGHRHRTFPVEALGEGGGEARRHVLGDEDRRTIGRHVHEHAFSASTPPVDAPIATILSRMDCRGRSRRGATRGAAARRTPTRASGGGLDLRLQLGGEAGHRVGDIGRRLGDEIDGADLERLKRDLGAGLRERRDHDHRHRPQRHDLAQERDAVHVRHLDIERDDVGIERLDAVARDVGDRRPCRRPRFRDRPTATSTAAAE